MHVQKSIVYSLIVRGQRTTRGSPGPLGERQIQILDRLVVLRSVLVADCNAIDTGVLDRESHCRFAVLTVEHTLSHKFHADYAHSFFAYLLDVANNFGDVAQSVSVVILGVHSDALVIHPDHGDVQPPVSGDLAQRRKPVNRRAVTYYSLLRLSLQNSILPPARVCGPCRCMLPVQQHNVEVFAIREFAELVEFLLRIHTLSGGHLRHKAIAIAWNALKGHSEHPVHLAVRLCSLEEANAAVVGVAHQPSKPVLSQVALYPAAKAACTKREPRHLHSRFSERYPICRGLSRRPHREAPGDAKGAGGESGFQEFTSGVVRHGCTSNWTFGGRRLGVQRP